MSEDFCPFCGELITETEHTCDLTDMLKGVPTEKPIIEKATDIEMKALIYSEQRDHFYLLYQATEEECENLRAVVIQKEEVIKIMEENEKRRWKRIAQCRLKQNDPNVMMEELGRILDDGIQEVFGNEFDWEE